MPKTSTTPDTEEAAEAAERRKLKGTNIELPAYVWEQVQAYFDEHRGLPPSDPSRRGSRSISQTVKRSIGSVKARHMAA